jgi:nicotinamidase-related amidase
VRIPIDTVLLVLGPHLDEGGPCARNNPDAEDWIAALVAVWGQCGMPVLHVRHDAGGRDATAPRPGPEETSVLAAPFGDAFIGTGLEKRLAAGGHTTLVVCGAPTDDAVAATARHAGCLGFRVFVAADACWAPERTGFAGETWPAETVHGVALAGLHGAYASIVEARTACEAAALIASRRK